MQVFKGRTYIFSTKTKILKQKTQPKHKINMSQIGQINTIICNKNNISLPYQKRNQKKYNEVKEQEVIKMSDIEEDIVIDPEMEDRVQNVPMKPTRKTKSTRLHDVIDQKEDKNGPDSHMLNSAESTASASASASPTSNCETQENSETQENPEDPLEFRISDMTSHMLSSFSDDLMSVNLQAMESQRTSHCLKNHDVSSKLRGKMVDWMIEVLTTYGCANETLFKAVKYMDMYLKEKSSKRLTGMDVHLLGIACMFTASKMEDLWPLTMALIHTSIAHKAFQPTQIKAMELDLLLTLGFKLPKTSILEFIQLSILQFKDEHKDLLTPDLVRMITEMGRAAIFYAKMALHDYKMLHNFDSLVAAGCIYAGIHKMQHKVGNNSYKGLLSKWMNDISGGSEKHIAQIEGCAIKLIDMEKNFKEKNPDYLNLYKFNAKLIE